MWLNHSPPRLRPRARTTRLECKVPRQSTQLTAVLSMHRYEVRPRKDKRGVDLISDAPPSGRLLYGEPNAMSNAMGYAQHCSRSHDVVIRVYDPAAKVVETPPRNGDSESRKGRLGSRVP